MFMFMFMFMFISEEPTHPGALWESSTAAHDLPALELLNSQHSFEISSVCQRLLVVLDCSQNSSSSILSKVVIARAGLFESRLTLTQD